MRRAGKIAVWSGGILTVLLVALTVVAATFDWNRIKPWLGEKVSQAAGRPFAIQGDLGLSWQRQQSNAAGWRARIPWPHFSAQQVIIGNPEWTNASNQFGRVEQIEFSINLFALPARRIVIPTLILRQPDLVLERIADGRNNWTFNRGEEGVWKLELGRIQLDDGRLRIVDAIRHADITATLNTLPQADADGYQMRWSLTGKLDGETVKGNGQAGPLLALREQDKPYPLNASLKVGKSVLSAHGTITRPRSLAAVDVQLELSGPSMAKLYPITTLLLPETSPYSTKGHLKGEWNEEGGNWIYQDFTGKVGASDLSGTLSFRAGKPRPRLGGTLVSNLLRFEDLGSLIGSPPESRGTSEARQTNAPSKQRNTTKDDDREGDKKSSTRSEKVLPDKKFRTERWIAVDAGVTFKGHKIVRSSGLPVENLETSLNLNNGVLRLDPLHFGVAGGRLTSEIQLDGRERKIKATMRIAARKLQLRQLFPKVDAMRGSIGELNGDARLSGSGDSVATLLGSSTGEVKALIERGTISKFVLEAMGLNIGSMVVTRLFGDSQVNINCMVSDFMVEQGVMKTRAFVVDTEDAVINVNGQINMAREQLDLVIDPESRNVRLFSLRSPLYVTGSFADPEIDVDKAVLAAKAGGAVALGVLAPVVTALLPLVNPGGGSDSGCRALLAKSGQRPSTASPR